MSFCRTASKSNRSLKYQISIVYMKVLVKLGIEDYPISNYLCVRPTSCTACQKAHITWWHEYTAHGTPNKTHGVSHSPHCNSQRGGYAGACCAPIEQPRDEMRRYMEHMQSCQSLHIRARVNASVRAYTPVFTCRRARAPLCCVRLLKLRLRLG